MIGERIHRLRIQLGLSQRQLAGKEMTRAFISQVENGKCTPSPQTLRVLADRLGKPISYFLEDDTSDAYGIRFLWEAAQKDAALGDWAAAQPKLDQALKMLRRIDDPEQEAAVQFLYAKCLVHLQQKEVALDHFEVLAERFRTLHKDIEVLQVWLEMGKCYTALEQFTTAKRFFERIIRHSVGSKSAQELHAEALCYLGSTLARLGENGEAINAFREALNTIKPSPNQVLWGRTAAGLAAAYLRAGNARAARDWSRLAMEQLEKSGSQDVIGAEHNLALSLMALGKPEEAYSLLRRVLIRWKEVGNARGQAGVLEDMVRYWKAKQEFEQAERLCWQAIDLLSDDNSWLRGLLYRHLGEIYIGHGNQTRALELLQLSYELLRRVRATDELEETRERMKSLSQSLDQAKTQGEV